MFDFLDIEFSSSLQKFILSNGLVVLQFTCSILCYLIAKMIQNEELTKLVKWAGFWLFIFGALKLAASFVDTRIGFEVYYFAYAVNYAFWILVVRIIFKFYHWLRKGFYLDQRRQEIKNNQALKATAEFSEHVSLGFDRQHAVSKIFHQLMEELKFQEELRNSAG